MKQLTCEMCGSNDLIKQDGVFVCQSCGCKYSVEEAKKMMVEVDGTVKVSVDNSDKIEAWKQLANSAYDNHSYEEAYSYYVKIVEVDTTNWFALFRKGMSKAWQSRLSAILYNEAFGGIQNAINVFPKLDYMAPSDIANAKGFMTSEIYNWLVAISRMVQQHALEFCPKLESACADFFSEEVSIINLIIELINIIDQETINACPENKKLLGLLLDFGNQQCSNVHQTFKVNTGSHWDSFWQQSVDDYKQIAASDDVILRANQLSVLIMKRNPEQVSAQPINSIGTNSALTEMDRAKVKSLLSSGQKLEAIKLVREKTGMGLKDAKDFVEGNPMPKTKRCAKCGAIYPMEMTSCPTCGSAECNSVTPSSTQASAGGCYIATCVYGSYDCPQVWTLRRYRDDTLGSTWYGRAFIRFYYATSPTLVKLFGKTNWFKRLWQGKLDRMVRKLNENGVENTPYQDKEW